MHVPIPTAATRWRCSLCGNVTRFDVTRTTRSREFVHLDLAGEPRVEEREVLADAVESVSCRWCGSGASIELVERPMQPAAAAVDASAPAATPSDRAEPDSS